MHLISIMPSPGLSLQRQWYLFESIRDFCPPYCQDILCPKPSTPKPTAAAVSENVTVQSSISKQKANGRACQHQGVQAAKKASATDETDDTDKTASEHDQTQSRGAGRSRGRGRGRDRGRGHTLDLYFSIYASHVVLGVEGSQAKFLWPRH